MNFPDNLKLNSTKSNWNYTTYVNTYLNFLASKNNMNYFENKILIFLQKQKYS